MPQIKRKPVPLQPLPSLSTILQPLPTSIDAIVRPLSNAVDEPIPILAPEEPPKAPPQSRIPPDADNDEEQLERLLGVFSGNMGLSSTKGKRPGTTVVTGQLILDGHAEDSEKNEVENVAWRIWDRECFYIPETGEIFTDYE